MLSSLSLALVTTGAAAEMPPDLRADLLRLGETEGDVEQRLTAAALRLMEAGWAADSLGLSAGRLRVHGARPESLRVVGLRGAEMSLPWSQGDRLVDPAAVERATTTWLAAMDVAGHPFAQVWLETGRDSLGPTLTALFSRGPSGRPGEMRIAGAERLDESFLRGLCGIDKSAALSRSAAERGRRLLLATDWFLAIEKPELGWDPVAERVGLLYRVQERPRPNRITALLGSGSGETTGALDLDLFSPFGRGRRWRLSGDWAGRQRSRLDLVFAEPRLFGHGLAMDLEFHRVKQDSTFLTLAVGVDLRLPLRGGWEGIAGIGYERNLFGLAGGEENDAESSRRRHRFGLAWRGLGESVSLQRRFRLVSDLLIKRSGLEGEEPESQQLAVNTSGRWTWRLAAPWKLRARGGGQLLWAPGQRFNAAELYPLGGALTLRGYDEEHFRGDRVAHLGSELALGDPLELTLFLDYGWGRWLRPGAAAVTFEGWGAGIGLHAPGERGTLSLALAVGESKRIEDIRVHLALDTGF